VADDERRPTDFIRSAIGEDLASGRFARVQTRWPPEPNGYPGIGHAKAALLNTDIAAEFGGLCTLRFDDTNPERESVEFVDALREDLAWLGVTWQQERFASDYFETLYEYARRLTSAGHAYVDSLSAAEMSAYRGAPNRPGRESPDRNRPAADSLDLLGRMRAGEFPDGSYTLRAKVDMASPNLNLRDPVMYRIRHVPHHRTGTAWPIYPSYDWAHGQSDSIEGVTHSLCSLEFENNRPLYDWFLGQLGEFRSRQIEFNHLYLTYATFSKRVLRALIERGTVHGWDDPRLLTLRGLRRRGYTASAVRAFVRSVGVTKTRVLIDHAQLEFHLRDELNRTAPRVMAVLHPLRVIITNYPEGSAEQVRAENNPEDPAAGSRQVPFSRELFIEAEDFVEDPPSKFFRLAPGREVRLKHAYYITCDEVVKDAAGAVVELRCSYDPDSRGGGTADGRKVKGTLQWVSAQHAVDAEVRLFEHLFTREDMVTLPEGRTAQDYINPDSETVLRGCKLEPALEAATVGAVFQFLRTGYFVVDADSQSAALVFNRAVGLRDSWAKVQRQAQPAATPG
jgi:glutaminyl-tRNA synthetase